MTYPKLGDKNSPEVKKIQQALNISPDGDFGPLTLAAIKDFQKRKLLLVDGIVGPLTWKRLFYEPLISKDVCPTSKVLSERAWEIALQYLHVREKTGHNDGVEVEMFLKSVNLGKGYPWCAAFVYFCYEKAAKDLGVPCPVPKTAGVLDMWNKSAQYRVTTPQAGDVFIMKFSNSTGHTGMVGRVTATQIHTVEGNTNAQGSREGNQVANRARNRNDNKILGYLRFS